MPEPAAREALRSKMLIAELLLVLGAIIGAAIVSLVWVPSVQPPRQATVFLRAYCGDYNTCDTVLDVIHENGRDSWKRSIPPGQMDQGVVGLTWSGPICQQISVELVDR